MAYAEPKAPCLNEHIASTEPRPQGLMAALFCHYQCSQALRCSVSRAVIGAKWLAAKPLAFEFSLLRINVVVLCVSFPAFS